MRICFLGTPEPAVPALRGFLDDPDADVVAVITNPDRPGGRGHKLQAPPVKVAALEAGVPVWQPDKPREVVDRLKALRLDACAIVAYGALLPGDVLSAGGRGFVNLHFSILPTWRGAAPVQHAILSGDAETGVSCFVLDEGMDTGGILATRRTAIEPAETAGELMQRLAALGAPVLLDAVKGFVDGTISPEPQDEEGASYAPKIHPDDARLDWRLSAAEVDRAVRAFNPVPGAHTTFGGERLKIHRVLPVDGGEDAGPAGAVLRAEGAGPVVACGAGLVRLEQVQPAGKPRMSGEAFANGYRPVGRVLGDGA